MAQTFRPSRVSLNETTVSSCSASSPGRSKPPGGGATWKRASYSMRQGHHRGLPPRPVYWKTTGRYVVNRYCPHDCQGPAWQDLYLNLAITHPGSGSICGFTERPRVAWSCPTEGSRIRPKRPIKHRSSVFTGLVRDQMDRGGTPTAVGGHPTEFIDRIRGWMFCSQGHKGSGPTWSHGRRSSADTNISIKPKMKCWHFCIRDSYSFDGKVPQSVRSPAAVRQIVQTRAARCRPGAGRPHGLQRTAAHPRATRPAASCAPGSCWSWRSAGRTPTDATVGRRLSPAGISWLRGRTCADATPPTGESGCR